MEEDEDALLARAIALSMQENQDMEDAAAAADASASASSSAATASSAAASTSTPAASTAAPSNADIDLAMQDPDFINSLLAGVPGAEGQQLDVRTNTQQNRQTHARKEVSARVRNLSLSLFSLC
jgi:hypothetical protein